MRAQQLCPASTCSLPLANPGPLGNISDCWHPSHQTNWKLKRATCANHCQTSESTMCMRQPVYTVMPCHVSSPVPVLDAPALSCLTGWVAAAAAPEAPPTSASCRCTPITPTPCRYRQCIRQEFGVVPGGDAVLSADKTGTTTLSGRLAAGVWRQPCHRPHALLQRAPTGALWQPCLEDCNLCCRCRWAQPGLQWLVCWQVTHGSTCQGCTAGRTCMLQAMHGRQSLLCSRSTLRAAFIARGQPHQQHPCASIPRKADGLRR